MQELAINLPHHVAVRSHGDQHTQSLQPAFRINPVHRQLDKTSAAIAQQVLNGSRRTEPHYLAAQPAQRARQRGLAQPELLLQGAGCGGASTQVQAEAVGVERHDLNPCMNTYMNAY